MLRVSESPISLKSLNQHFNIIINRIEVKDYWPGRTSQMEMLKDVIILSSVATGARGKNKTSSAGADTVPANFVYLYKYNIIQLYYIIINME